MVKKINSSKTKKTGNLKKKEEIQKELPQEHLAVQDISDDSSEEEDTLDKTNANKRSRIAKAQKDIDTLKEIEKNTGVIYVGHLPWGFLDEGLKKYFDQFGQIERLLVPRSKKSGRSKGYAFVEFADRGTAEIAAKTMHNYILFDKVLQCHLVEDTSKYNLIFKRWKRKFKFNDKYQNYVEEKNKSKDSEQLSSYVQLLLDKEEAKKSKLKEMGIKYEFPGYKAIIDKRRTPVPSKTKQAKGDKATAKKKK